MAAAPAESAPVKQEPAADVKVATPAKRTANKKALRSKPEATTAKTDGTVAPASLNAMEARIKAIEEGLKPKATQLKEAVETKVEKLGE